MKFYMRFLEIAKRNLKEFYREPIALGWLLGIPLFFILIFSWAFGKETMPSYLYRGGARRPKLPSQRLCGSIETGGEQPF